MTLVPSRACSTGLSDERTSKGAKGFWGRDVGFKEITGGLGIPRYTQMYRSHSSFQESDLGSTDDLQKALALLEWEGPVLFIMTNIC